MEKERDQPIEIWAQMRGEFKEYAARFHVPKNSARGYLEPPKEYALRELQLASHTPFLYLGAPEYRKVPPSANASWKEVVMCGEIYRTPHKPGY